MTAGDGRHVAIVVAHPDDETVGCGGLLGRLAGATVVVATDGAPRDLGDAHAYGFATAADYAAARAGELRAACALAGCGADRIVELGIPDQRAAYEMVPLARRLRGLFEGRGIRVAMTHAYEGGHPDHDATCFAVHAAARLMPAPPAIVEMPFYRLDEAGGVALQSFAAGGPPVLRLDLTPAERERKRRMLAAHRTQTATLAPFGTAAELFRSAPVHSFVELPNGGRLLYEAHDWGLDGAGWLALAGAALAELGLRD